MHLVNIFQTLSPRTNPYARASFLPRFSLRWKKVSRRRERAFFPREKFFSTIIVHPFIIFRSFSFPRTSFLRLLSTDTHNYAFRMHTGIEALNIALTLSLRQFAPPEQCRWTAPKSVCTLHVNSFRTYAPSCHSLVSTILF